MSIHNGVLGAAAAVSAQKPILLHVGCGGKDRFSMKGFAVEDWAEQRLDINPDVRPDILGSITDMAMVPSDSVDALYSSHNLEHVYPHEVSDVLSEFKRVLKPEGFVVLTCPDLQSVCGHIAAGRLDEPLYVSPAGPIAPLDVLYGFRPSIARGDHFMAHRCGFTAKTLREAFAKTGFGALIVGVQKNAFALWILAFKEPCTEDRARTLASRYLP